MLASLMPTCSQRNHHWLGSSVCQAGRSLQACALWASIWGEVNLTAWLQQTLLGESSKGAPVSIRRPQRLPCTNLLHALPCTCQDKQSHTHIMWHWWTLDQSCTHCTGKCIDSDSSAALMLESFCSMQNKQSTSPAMSGMPLQNKILTLRLRATSCCCCSIRMSCEHHICTRQSKAPSRAGCTFTDTHICTSNPQIFLFIHPSSQRNVRGSHLCISTVLYEQLHNAHMSTLACPVKSSSPHASLHKSSRSLADLLAIHE
jgi:hypothetical protein